jgi:hypothetical protein
VHYACLVGKRRGPESVRERSGSGWLPLHFAARSGGLDEIRFFHEKCPEAVRGGYPGRRPAPHPPFALRGEPWVRGFPASLLESVRFLVRQYPPSRWKPTNDGDLPLHAALARAPYVDVDVIRLVVRQEPMSVRVANSQGTFVSRAVRRLRRQGPAEVAVPSRRVAGLGRVQDHVWRLAASPGVGARPTVDGGGASFAGASAAHVPGAELGRVSPAPQCSCCQEHCNARPRPPCLGSHPAGLLKADSRGSIPLHLALSRGAPDVELVRLILDRHPPSLVAADPLHVVLSSSTPNLELVRFLVEQHLLTGRQCNAMPGAGSSCKARRPTALLRWRSCTTYCPRSPSPSESRSVHGALRIPFDTSCHARVRSIAHECPSFVMGRQLERSGCI